MTRAVGLRELRAPVVGETGLPAAPGLLGGMVRGLPTGRRRAWGAPFDFGGGPVVVPPNAAVEIAVGALAGAVILATACAPAADGPSGGETPDAVAGAELDATGEVVAVVEALGAGGRVLAAAPWRRRFETAPPVVDWGRQPFVARPHREDRFLSPAGPYAEAQWGRHQTTVIQAYGEGPCYWLAALDVLPPGVVVDRLRISTGGSALLVGAVTAWTGRGAALAGRREAHVAIDGPVEVADVTVLDGTLIRAYRVDPVTRASWFAGGLRGMGSAEAPMGRLVVEVAEGPATKLRLGRRVVALGPLADGVVHAVGERAVTRLPMPRVRVHVALTEDGRPAPGRIHLRAADGRELAPVDRTRLVSDRFLEDAGEDVVVGGWRYAYVDGGCDVIAPPGDLFVEAARGPAFEVLRSVHEVPPAAEGMPGPGIELSPRRIADPRAEGWLASDTHVHFLSPVALHRQARAEGLELVHLMGAQWGGLRSNAADLADGPSVVSDEAVVWTGTENRHHALGHLLSVGTSTVRPLSSGGPVESTVGDATSVLLADWAGAARAGGGLAILAHFPDPYLEAAIDLLLGRVDAVELRLHPLVGGASTRTWYRFLNLGLRVPAVSGTDKMAASTVLGAVRTYAWTGSRAIDYAAWAAAIRAGRTCVSSGPFLDVTVDGELPGGRLADVPAHEVRWRIRSAAPVDTFEVVANGDVVHREPVPVATPLDRAGAVTLRLPREGWIAARCSGPDVLTEARTSIPFQVGAHTSPYYLARRARPRRSDVDHVRTLLAGAGAWARHATWERGDVRERFIALVAEAEREAAALGRRGT